jgi:TnpA family transposase
MIKKDMTLTSVKVQSELFEQFKVSCVKHKFSLQKLADRTIHLYLTDEEFRRKIHNHNNLKIENKN